MSATEGRGTAPAEGRWLPGLGAAQRRLLLEVARTAIEHGLRVGGALEVDAGLYPQALRERWACFVTLTRDGELRGCVGCLEPQRPLVEQVAASAFDAAFLDTRMAAVGAVELPRLVIEVAVLSQLVEMEVGSEAELLARLRPGIDGLVLVEGSRRATFLPKVWQQLREPAVFLHHLRVKAGLAGGYWSPSLRFERYQTESFSDAEQRS